MFGDNTILEIAYMHNLVYDICKVWLPKGITDYDIDITEAHPLTMSTAEVMGLRICIDFTFEDREMGTNTVILGHPYKSTEKELVFNMISSVVFELQQAQIRQDQEQESL